MIITGNPRYQISTAQFDNLFTDKVKIKTLDVLGKSAAEGNIDCIDMLHNLALRHDAVGKKAENILFDLFSGKKQGKSGVEEEIKQASLKLYQTACNAKEVNNEDMKKFDAPSKLLYMAGSAIENLTQRQDLSAIFRQRDTAQSPLEQFENLDFWSDHRMLMTDEINSAMGNVILNPDNFSLNFPIGLIEPTRNSNMLSEQIFEKTISGSLLNKPELFPINTGNHWILFALYNDGVEGNKCAVFNSFSDLNGNTKNSLIDSARIAGVPNENVEFINGDMQKNVPNGCGLFVIKAMELLSHAPEKKPVDSLKKFSDDFSKLSVQEQELFNIQTRRQMFGHSML